MIAVATHPRDYESAVSPPVISPCPTTYAEAIANAALIAAAPLLAAELDRITLFALQAASERDASRKRVEALEQSLQKARACIFAERAHLIDCFTVPGAGPRDLSTMDDDEHSFVAALDNELASIDLALAGSERGA